MAGFSYSDPGRIQLYIHFAVASGSGTGIAATSPEISPPAGWEVVLTTDDGVNSPAPGTSIAVFDTSQSVPTMQATAFRNMTTGEVVVAYRGTDDAGELSFTSIPLGAGIPESEGLITESYLQVAYDFYAQALTGFAGSNKNLVSFTGSSLGGIVAGAMGAITNLEALTLATGPHTLVLQNLLPPLTLRSEDAALVPDAAGVFNLRIAGEVLNDAVELVRSLVQLADVLGGLGLLSPGDAAAVDALLDQFGDGVRVGTNLPELNAGSTFDTGLLAGILKGDISDSVLLHYAASHALHFHAQAVLGFVNYREVDGFSKAFYDPALFAVNANSQTAPLEFLTMSVLDAGPDILTPLLGVAETQLFAIQSVNFAPELISGDGSSLVTTSLARLVVEYAFAAQAQGLAFGAPVSDISGGWVTFDHATMFPSGDRSVALSELLTVVLPGLGGAIAPDIDTIVAQAGSVTTALTTGGTNDLVLMGDGAQTVTTGDGRDIVVGGAGADIISTGAQDDVIVAGRGAQTINGGEGSDWLVYTASDFGVTVNLATGTGVSGSADGDAISSVENLLGSKRDDTLSGNGETNILYGDAGRDVLFGKGGADLFVFLPGSEIDIIADFNQSEGDRALIGAGLAADFVALSTLGTDVTGGTVFSFADGGKLAFAGLSLAEFTVEDFLFA